MDNLEELHFTSSHAANVYHAAVVEDDPSMLQYIRQTLADAFAVHKVSMEFDTFPSGDRFLEMIHDHYHYDLVFLDIEMPGINGIEVCRRIRQINPDSLVVFISGKEELVFQTFEVQPFRFIRKNQYLSQLPALTAACMERLQKSARQIIRFREPHSGDLYSFHVDKIRYVEALGKSCKIVTDNESIVVKGKFMTLEELLRDYAFVKPHRSYLVNCNYIYCIGRQSLKLTDQTEIPISRNKSEQIKQQFLEYTMY